ncbi:MAG: hypothetical protein A2744_03265 [Candidatus Buchananbacteria bacterium RIFCSPHIGHO2_01_FULL_44_11]|uniref:NADPH-dependent FMN reductase-like domain-containing protein n=1 Tax=Candidatus Buchananbacteria bacterium RIFCSPHIGHO2_01_FULL_44_11 TaxID=1797535 RepID=A0A1G1Y2K8_9BACT|nr:MAG: hypothetical protein A2744_03265 [Candidatus Buchananbacteria bacterium RIFCSPHIGHO2_01_FULL_44_11]
MKKLDIPILLATGRQGRFSEAVAHYVLAQAKDYGFETQLVDVRDYSTTVTIPPWEEKKGKKTWSKIMAQADGLIIVSPEYNHGYPGEFKIVFDQLEKEYAKKPVAVCGVSDGRFGGARLVGVMLPILRTLQMVALKNSVHFSTVDELFDEAGKIKDQSYQGKLKKMFDELNWYAAALKKAREKDL